MAPVIRAEYTGIDYGGHDNRKLPRFFAKLPIVVKDPLSRSELFVMEVNSEDISTRGMRISTSYLLQPKAKLELWIKFQDNDELQRIFGEVDWVKKGDSNTWQAGVSFYSNPLDLIPQNEA